MSVSEWKVVTHKKHASSNRNRKKCRPHVTDVSSDCDVTICEEKVRAMTTSLLGSDFCNKFLADLLGSLDGDVDRVVCYGLGRPTTSRSSANQLALLIIIKSFLHKINTGNTLAAASHHSTMQMTSKDLTSFVACEAFDPAFTNDDIRLLKCFHITIIGHNEEVIRPVAMPTFFFMPHCDLWMYNNLLWSNWSSHSLGKLIILGNSFQLMTQSNTNRRLLALYRYIYLAHQWALYDERPLPVWKDYDVIFNDTSLMRFRKASCSKMAAKIVESYLPGEAPNYDEQ